MVHVYSIYNFEGLATKTYPLLELGSLGYWTFTKTQKEQLCVECEHITEYFKVDDCALGYALARVVVLYTIMPAYKGPMRRLQS